MRFHTTNIIPVILVSILLLSSIEIETEDHYDAVVSKDMDADLDIKEIGGAAHNQAKLLKEMNDLSIRNQAGNGDERTLIEFNGRMYFIYAWFNSSKSGSPITVSVISSSDNGDTWTSRIDLWDSTYYQDCIFKHLLVWKGDLYAFYGAYHSTRTYRTCYMKKTPTNNWRGLRTATQVTIRDIQAQSWKITHDDNYLYMSMVRASQWQLYFYRYDGSSWTSGTALSSPGHAGQSSIIAYDTGSGTKLLIFYARQYVSGYSNGYINMRTSTNNGNTWSSARVIMNNVNTYMHMATRNINGTILLFASAWGYDDIDLSISRDGGSTWTPEKRIISSRGLSTIQSTNVDFTVNTRSNGRVVCLAYEGGTDEINMIYSKDWGSNWISESKEITLYSPDAYDPILSEDASYLVCMVENGTNYDALIFDIQEVYLDDSSPKNLTASSDYFSVDLDWDTPKDETFNNFDFQSYRIYRGTDPGSMYLLATIGNTTTYTDFIPSYENRSYYYQVSSVFSSIGESSPTRTVNKRPLIPEPPQNLDPTSGDFQISLAWDKPVTEVTDMFPVEHYNIYRGNYADSLIKVAETMVPAYTDTNIDRYPARYFYKVSYTLNTVGEGEMSDLISAKPNTLPGMPADISYDEIAGGYNIKWKSPRDNGCCPILSYNIYRGDHPTEMELLTNQPTLNIDQTGMEAGSSYYYSISAVNRLGESMHTEPVLINYLGAASAPENFIATGMDSKIELKWDMPRVTWGLSIDSYYIFRGTSTRDLDLYQTVDGDVLSYTDFVINGIDYEYEILAVNLYGESERAGPVTARATTVPGQVTDITVAVGNMSVRLRWELPADDGGAEITHYTIYRSFEIESPDELETVASGLETYFDAPLTNGVTYYYFISASNMNGEGALSELVSAKPGTEPYAVKQISASPFLYSARINWQYPESGGYEIVKFVVYRGDSVRSLHPYKEIVPDMSLNEHMILDKDLTYGQRYYYAITSENQFGESVFSPIVSVTPYGAPSQPIVYEVEQGLNDFTVKWNEPADDGKMPIIGYRFHYRILGDLEWEILDLEELQIRIPNLDAGETYQVHITAYNQLAEGSASNNLLIELGGVPDKMDTPTISGMNSACKIVWIEPETNGHDILSYIIYMVDEKGFNLILDEVEGSISSYLATNLLNGVEYTFRVSAINKKGESEISDDVSAKPMTIPEIPKELYVEQLGDGFVDIAWSAPLSNGGSQITTYNVYRSNSLGLEILLDTVDGSTFSYSDTDLQNGLKYFYMVKAVNIIGEGGESNTISVTPLAPPKGVIDLKLSATTDTVTITWAPPTDNGGTPVIGYILYKGRSRDSMEVLSYLEPEVITFIDEDVVAGKYYYSVEPYNAEGTGETSAGSVEVPPRMPMAIMIGIVAFLIPLIIGLLAVIIPLLIARSKKKQERLAKEALERKEEEQKTREPAGPGLPVTVQGPQTAPRLQAPLNIQMNRTLPPASQVIPTESQQTHMRAPPLSNLQTAQTRYTSEEASYQRPQK